MEYIVQTIKEIVGGTDKKTIQKWVNLMNEEGPERTEVINVYYWIKRGSVPPQMWIPFSEAAGEFGQSVTLKDLFEIWLESRKKRAENRNN